MTKGANGLLVTAAVAVSTLLLGIPVAIVTIILVNTYVPDVVLGTKSIDAGPSGPKTITFNLQTGPDDAVLASAYISFIASVTLAAWIIVMRHIVQAGRIAGWGALATAITNLLGQIGCVVAWFTLMRKDESKHADAADISFDGKEYDSAGKMFTREAWACSMNALFHGREGEWAEKACDNLKKARFATIATVVFAVVMGAIAFWQFHAQGGFSWPKGGGRKREKNSDIAMEEYRRV